MEQPVNSTKTIPDQVFDRVLKKLQEKKVPEEVAQQLQEAFKKDEISEAALRVALFSNTPDL